MSKMLDAGQRHKIASPPRVIASTIILALATAACSMAKPPTETLARAELGLRAASEARAAEFAPTDLQSARGKIERSKQALAAQRYEDARRLAESAQVEAELAEAKAEAEIMRLAAEEIRKRSDVLRMETDLTSRKSAPDKE
jgi:Domain of unknown function (DUF4398)